MIWFFLPGRKSYIESDSPYLVWRCYSQMGWNPQQKYNSQESTSGIPGENAGQTFPQESLCSSGAYNGAVSSRWLPNELVMVAPRYNQSHKVHLNQSINQKLIESCKLDGYGYSIHSWCFKISVNPCIIRCVDLQIFFKLSLWPSKNIMMSITPHTLPISHQML